MQSYFSTYFSSSNQSAHGTPPQSSSGTSTWSDTLSSRLQGLRKALTTNSEQDDPDNEDASHVSNVLRGYYTEMGRPFPSWLPPDPKKPAVALPPQQSSQYGQFGNTYGGYGANQYGNTQQPVSRNPGGRGGGLSDLWDSAPAQPAAAPVPQSLRTRPERPVPQSLLQSQNSARSSESFTPPQSRSQSSQNTTRLLPSQRAGSYQSAAQNTSAAGAAGAGSRDRLRARLQAGGSGRNSPTLSASGGSYGQSAYTADSAYGGGGSGGSPSPFVSASQPWVGGDDEFNGGYGGGGSDDTGYHNPRSGASGLARALARALFSRFSYFPFVREAVYRENQRAPTTDAMNTTVRIIELVEDLNMIIKLYRERILWQPRGGLPTKPTRYELGDEVRAQNERASDVKHARRRNQMHLCHSYLMDVPELPKARELGDRPFGKGVAVVKAEME